MTEKIVLSTVSIAMLIFTLQKGDKQSTFLTAGLTIGILITWVNVSQIITLGLVIYMLSALMISFLHLRIKNLSKLKLATIILTGFVAFISNLFSIMSWPGFGAIRLILIIPIVLYILVLIKGMIKRKELGYLTIMNTEMILRMI